MALLLAAKDAVVVVAVHVDVLVFHKNVFGHRFERQSAHSLPTVLVNDVEVVGLTGHSVSADDGVAQNGEGRVASHRARCPDNLVGIQVYGRDVARLVARAFGKGVNAVRHVKDVPLYDHVLNALIVPHQCCLRRESVVFKVVGGEHLLLVFICNDHLRCVPIGRSHCEDMVAACCVTEA